MDTLHVYWQKSGSANDSRIKKNDYIILWMPSFNSNSTVCSEGFVYYTFMRCFGGVSFSYGTNFCCHNID